MRYFPLFGRMQLSTDRVRSTTAGLLDPRTVHLNTLRNLVKERQINLSDTLVQHVAQQSYRKDATYLAVVGAPLADTVRGRLDLGSAGGVELLFNGRVTAAVFALPAATLVEAIRHVQLAVSSPPPGHFAFASTRRLWFAAPCCVARPMAA
jgi:hypothetical protein